MEQMRREEEAKEKTRYFELILMNLMAPYIEL